MISYSAGWRNSRFGFIALLTLVMAGMTACGSLAPDEAKWTEEVKLHDGTFVTIERRATRNKGIDSHHRGRLKDNELWYKPMNIYWKNSPRTAGWILSFEIVDGIAYLVVDTPSRKNCNIMESKGEDGYYISFLQWKNGEWIPIPQDEFPLHLATMNIYRYYWGYTSVEDAHGFLSWNEKVARADGRYEERYDAFGNAETLEQWANRQPPYIRCSHS